MVIYEDYGTNKLGVELVRAYSDTGYFIEREEVMYAEAIDPKNLDRKYTETDIAIEDDEATAEDYETALQEVGVEL